MGFLPLLLTMGLGLGAAAYAKSREVKPAGYPPVPSIVDPSVWPAGTTAARRAGQSSGQPQGLKWNPADWVTKMPGLLGR